MSTVARGVSQRCPEDACGCNPKSAPALRRWGRRLRRGRLWRLLDDNNADRRCRGDPVAQDRHGVDCHDLDGARERQEHPEATVAEAPRPLGSPWHRTGLAERQEIDARRVIETVEARYLRVDALGVEHSGLEGLRRIPRKGPDRELFRSGEGAEVAAQVHADALFEHVEVHRQFDEEKLPAKPRRRRRRRRNLRPRRRRRKRRRPIPPSMIEL